MGKQISFYLDDEKAVKRLMEKAALECRRPNDHARYVILKSLGLVIDDGPSLENSKIASVKVGPSQTGDFAGINP